MKISKLLIIMLLATAKIANAVVVQKVYLKNGSVLNGYVQQQDGKGNLIIKTDNATICLTNKNVSTPTDNYVGISSLSKEWKDWAEKNDAYIGIGDSRQLLLSDIRTGVNNYLDSVAVDVESLDFEARLKEDEKLFTQVRVLEKGSMIKFLELTPNTYKVKWSDIESIQADKRPKNALSGVDRKYYLKGNREVSGQYAGETATTMSLYQSNGMVETVNFSDVMRYTFYAVNPNQDIFAQSELLDVVKTRYNEIRGVIIEQNYSSTKDAENYISIWEKGKSPQIVKIPEIKAICKEENKDYAPKFDIILKEGEVVVNRKPVEYLQIKESNDVLVLDSLSHKVKIEPESNGTTKLTVEYRNSSTPNVEMFQLVKVTKTIVKKKPVYSFSYKDLVNSAYRASGVETSVNHTTRATYSVVGKGVFALYDAKNKRAIPIIISDK